MVKGLPREIVTLTQSPAALSSEGCQLVPRELNSASPSPAFSPGFALHGEVRNGFLEADINTDIVVYVISNFRT